MPVPPAFLTELWSLLAEPAPEWELAGGLYRQPFSSYSRMTAALSLCFGWKYFTGEIMCV